MAEKELFTEPSIGQIPTDLGTEGKFTGEYKILPNPNSTEPLPESTEEKEWKEVYKNTNIRVYENKTQTVIILNKRSDT